MVATNVVVAISELRKVTVKTTPATTLKAVLDQACREAGLSDAVSANAGYGLKHRGKPLDLSTSIRLSGLVSGAKLELCRREKKSSLVTVALALDGNRSALQFSPDCSLLSILQAFESHLQTNLLHVHGNNGLYQQPVCVAANQRFDTLGSLAETSLESIGISDGSALVRLSFQPTAIPIDQIKIPEPTSNKQEAEESTNPATASTENPATRVKSAESTEAEDPTATSVKQSNTTATDPSHASQSESTNEVFRNMKVLKCNSTNIVAEDLPDSFYELSETELKMAFAGYQRRTQELQNRPLMTKKLREAQTEQSRNKYPKVLVRFMFPSLALIEATFLSSEDPVSLYEFVDSLVVNSEYMLSTKSFPKKDIPRSGKRDLTLFDLGLAPASVLLVECREGNFLRPAILRSAVGAPETTEPVQGVVEESGPRQDPSAFQQHQVDDRQAIGPGSRQNEGSDSHQQETSVDEKKKQTGGGSSSIEQKLARWLQLKRK